MTDELEGKFKSKEAAMEEPKLEFRVGVKGGCSVYGLGRFPVTLYYEQWIRLLGASKDLKDYLEAHKPEFKTKP
jgi:hypothetical protein